MEAETPPKDSSSSSGASGGDPETENATDSETETIASECRSAKTSKKKVSRGRKVLTEKAGLKLNHRDKRKFHYDEDENQKKRKREPMDGDTSDSYSSDSQIDSSSGGVSPLKEIDNRFSWEFWRNLHSCYASFLSYIVGFFVLLFFNHEWMLDEFADNSETYLVSKTFVILFLLFGYSGITLAIEIIQLAILCLEICVPSLSRRIRNGIQSFGCKSNLRKQIAFYFQILLLIIWCIAFVALSSRFWNWFWLNHICKSHHDRTCRNSWIGQRVIAYRDEACFDGSASSAVCEKLVSYFPILIICVFYIFVANVVMPLANDLLSVRLPIPIVNKKEAFSFGDIMNNLDSSKILTDLEDSTGPCDFSLARKNFNFGVSDSVDSQDPGIAQETKKTV